MFDKLSHPMIYVNDLGRAVNWYRDILGFEPRFHIPHVFASLYHHQMNQRIDLHPTESNSKDVGYGSISYFNTRNFDGCIEELKRKGVKVGVPKQEGNSPRFVTFWDSEGNALGVEEVS